MKSSHQQDCLLGYNILTCPAEHKAFLYIVKDEQTVSAFDAQEPRFVQKTMIMPARSCLVSYQDMNYSMGQFMWRTLGTIPAPIAMENLTAAVP